MDRRNINTDNKWKYRKKISMTQLSSVHCTNMSSEEWTTDSSIRVSQITNATLALNAHVY